MPMFRVECDATRLFRQVLSNITWPSYPLYRLYVCLVWQLAIFNRNVRLPTCHVKWPNVPCQVPRCTRYGAATSCPVNRQVIELYTLISFSKRLLPSCPVFQWSQESKCLNIHLPKQLIITWTKCPIVNERAKIHSLKVVFLSRPLHQLSVETSFYPMVASTKRLVDERSQGCIHLIRLTTSCREGTKGELCERDDDDDEREKFLNRVSRKRKW